MAAEHPTADVSVRLAWPDDAEAVAAVQVRAWQEGYAEALPADVLQSLPQEEFATRWRQAIERPEEARQRVLVALERATVRGFAAIQPSTDEDSHPGRDAEVAELVVDPDHRRTGHGSRLLHAVVDTLRADDFSRATLWLNSGSDVLHTFLNQQGWGTDGASRQLDLYGDGSVCVKQVRLHTDLTPE